jgi:hypothetical protein
MKRILSNFTAKSDLDPGILGFWDLLENDT